MGRQVLLQVSFGALHVDRSRLLPGELSILLQLAGDGASRASWAERGIPKKAAATIQPVYS